MASDLEDEKQSDSEISVIHELLSRDGPITYNRYGSLVAEEESPETVVETDQRVATEVAREPFTF